MPKLLFLALSMTGIAFILYQMYKTEKIRKSSGNFSK